MLNWHVLTVVVLLVAVWASWISLPRLAFALCLLVIGVGALVFVLMGDSDPAPFTALAGLFLIGSMFAYQINRAAVALTHSVANYLRRQKDRRLDD